MQGEYVAVSQLEAAYQGACPSIDQIFIHGSIKHSCLLAVLVPSPSAHAAMHLLVLSIYFVVA
jgi:long-subunit acyl-CoA synthetase (AMP-forming)